VVSPYGVRTYCPRLLWNRVPRVRRTKPTPQKKIRRGFLISGKHVRTWSEEELPPTCHMPPSIRSTASYYYHSHHVARVEIVLPKAHALVHAFFHHLERWSRFLHQEFVVLEASWRLTHHPSIWQQSPFHFVQKSGWHACNETHQYYGLVINNL